MKRIITALSFIACSHASIINMDALNKIQSVQVDIKSLQMVSGLSQVETKSLDSLQYQSDALAQIIYKGKCTSVSINSMPNPECKTIGKKLDVFMDIYSKFSKKIYFSKMKSIESYADKNAKMIACVEAMPMFINNSLDPTNLYPLSVESAQEQISEDSVLFNFNIKFLNEAFAKKTKYYEKTIADYESNLAKWNEKCFIPITYDLNRGSDIIQGYPTFNFIKKVNELYSKTNMAFGTSRRLGNINIGWKESPKYEISVINSSRVIVHKFIVSYDYDLEYTYTKRGINDGNSICKLNKNCEPAKWHIIGLSGTHFLQANGSLGHNMLIEYPYSEYAQDGNNPSLMLPVDSYTIEIKKI
jgi:hypothetical protein